LNFVFHSLLFVSPFFCPFTSEEQVQGTENVATEVQQENVATENVASEVQQENVATDYGPVTDAASEVQQENVASEV
jgi:hypothetical protein